ncbi:MAG: glutamate synthase (NADPH/NADH) small chain [Maribacter sp.]|jgi:glutamate synthase (NADPH/NADH) small chain
MANPKGFIKYKRTLPQSRTVSERVKDYKEIYVESKKDLPIKQAARCMDCGVPFCHNGCPLGNVIPDFNEAVYQEKWEKAYHILNETNNFPEFTGRICPAPCESSCVLGINQPAVAIEFIEKSIIETAFKNGWVKAKPPIYRTGKKVAVVGSGPAGLAAAAELNSAGHSVIIFEKNDKVGGLLRYGIPDFKLEKWVVDRRLKIMESEGIRFKTNTNVGVDISVEELKNDFDAVLLCGGSTIPRDLPIKGRELKGIHFAMDFLEQSNRRVNGEEWFSSNEAITAKNKNVVVIGGGDTGSDCVGTSNRQNAKSINQIELLASPPINRSETTPWPMWPMQLRTSSSHEEGCNRKWAILTKEFIGDKNGHLTGIKLVNIEWSKNETTGRNKFKEIEGTEKIIPCEIAFLAIGFLYPKSQGLLENLGVELTERGNVKSNQNYQTNIDHIFTAGDMKRGQSLVVWAIAEGREAAKAVDDYLAVEE